MTRPSTSTSSSSAAAPAACAPRASPPSTAPGSASPRNTATAAPASSAAASRRSSSSTPRPSPTPSRTPAATAGRVEKPRFDWSRLVAAKDAEIARLEAAYHDRLRRAGVQLCAARADDPRPAPGAARRPGRNIPRATFSSPPAATPCVPAIPGAELGITSNEIFDLETQPKRMLIVGGGYVACEFAGIMNGLGTHVIQLYRGDQILRGFDEDLRDDVAGAMRARGDRARDRARRHPGREGRAAASGSASTTARRTSSTRCSSPPGAGPTPPGSSSSRSA